MVVKVGGVIVSRRSIVSCYFENVYLFFHVLKKFIGQKVKLTKKIILIFEKLLLLFKYFLDIRVFKKFFI